MSAISDIWNSVPTASTNNPKGNFWLYALVLIALLVVVYFYIKKTKENEQEN